MNDRWDETADVVVLGSGCAGATAAITAREHGAEVLVVEKQPRETQCTNTGLSGGCIISPQDRDMWTKYLEGLWQVPGEQSWVGNDIVRVYAEYSIGNVDWLRAHGGQIVEGEVAHGQGHGEHSCIEGFDAIRQVRFAGMGLGLHRFLHNALRAKDIPVSYGTAGQSLVTDSAGRVIGVEAEKKDGAGAKKVRIGASRGVVIATGGFEYNETMKLNYLPVHPTYFTGSPASTGDGIRMAMAIGSDLWHMNCVSGRLVAKFPGIPMGFTVSLDSMMVRGLPGVAKADAQKRPGYVLVDRDGKRFTNETYKWHCLYYELTNFDTQRLVYPRVPTCWIFDHRRMAVDKLVTTRGGAAGTYQLYKWSKDNVQELEKGWFHTASSIKELAAKMKLPADSLERTILAYNRSCDQGKDLEFGRSPDSLIPLDEPPFYGLKLWPGGPNTLGGPRRNARSQILNVDGNPIRGLYGAGEMGSIFGMLYPAGGGNLSECLAMGRVAGENATRESRT